MDKITIQKLCEKIEKEILSKLEVNEFYIGQTDNIERRKHEHQIEHGRQVTLAVAESHPEIINEAEKQVIAYFKAKQDDRLKNVGDGGEGPNGNLLYISIKIDLKGINDIDDVDIKFKSVKL